MKRIGKTVCDGIAMGPMVVLKKKDTPIQRSSVLDVKAELVSFEKSIETAKKQLQELYGKALVEVGEEHAAIFEVHQMMLEDDSYIEEIQALIETEAVNAPYAIETIGNQFADIFANMDDEYMKARSVDIKDVSNRLVRILLGQEEAHLADSEPSIIVAEDLTPSETVQMDKKKILAFVTKLGSSNSHTAILARMMNIPALIGVPIDLEGLVSGELAIVDGMSGAFITNPTREECEVANAKIKEEQEKQRLLQAMKGQETITRDGRKIELCANIGSVADIEQVLENDAEGIGLFRSEFLYLEKNQLPTEEEQFIAYRKVVETMAGKRVIIRTLDIGADKQVDYLGLGHEENPALGYRAIRICLSQPEIFKTQLRALLRAAVYGNLAVMYPMITSTKEVEQIYKIVEEVKQELEAEGIPYATPKQGIMIETPAAVMMSDELAKRVEFFSIGTNDLSQYTLAIDRQNEKLESFYDAHHPAILKMIEMVTSNAHKNGIWVGICGELGADSALTETFLQIGVDELSVAPGMILKLREKIRTLSVSEMKQSGALR